MEFYYLLGGWLRTLDDIRTIVLEGWHSYEMETAVQMFRKEGVFAGVK